MGRSKSEPSTSRFLSKSPTCARDSQIAEWTLFEVYRGGKAALNMLMRSFAARHRDDTRTLLLMAPGWRTWVCRWPHVVPR